MQIIDQLCAFDGGTAL